MRILKWLTLGILVLVGGALLSLMFLINMRPDLSASDHLYAQPAQSDVTVRFFGTSSLLFSDGDTNIMVDGWFSRPSTLDTLLGKVAPDVSAVEYGLTRLGNPKISALVATHSHLDHAMDVAEVAMRTEALLVGSESTANIGRGGGLPEQQIKIARDGEALSFGNFTLTLIESRHFVVPDSSILAGIEKTPTIDAPVVPPVSAYAYRTGVTYSVLVSHPAGTALVHASPGAKAGSLEGIHVDVVYLGVGFVAWQSAEYQDNWWREIVTRTRPRHIYLIHWDSLSYPLEKIGNRPVAANRLWNDVIGMHAQEGIDIARERAEAAGISTQLLPMWEKVDAFAIPLRKGGL